MNTIKNFWSNYSPHNLHPEDLEYLGEKFSKYCLDYGADEMKDRYGDDLSSDTTNKNFYNDGKKKHKIFSTLYPVPFFGNILTAKVYILSGNPGFHTLNFIEDYENKTMINLLKRNIKLDFLDLPFNLDKSVAFTGGYKYWEPIYKKIVEELAVNSNRNFEEIKEYVYRNVAVIESVVYHSQKKPDSKLFKLPSSELNKMFVHDYVMERVSANEAMIFVWRGVSHWELDADEENILVRNSNAAIGTINSEEIGVIGNFLAS